MASPTNLEQVQTDIATKMRAQSREAAVRALLHMLDYHDDDWQQDYPEILRRAQNALAVEFHQVCGTEQTDG